MNFLLPILALLLIFIFIRWGREIFRRFNPKKEPAASDIHFDCPKCKRPMAGDKTLANEMITCPDCAEVFIPTPRPFTPSPAMVVEEKSLASNTRPLREQADGFCKIAAAVLILAVLLFGVGLIKCLNQQSYLTEFVLAGALVSVAVWLYLIGQIIHIRANTEK